MADTTITLNETPWRNTDVEIYPAAVVDADRVHGNPPSDHDPVQTIAVTDGGSLDITVAGEDAATLVTGVVASDNAIRWTAQDPGSAGNDITIALVDPDTGQAEALAVDVTGSAITVNLEAAEDDAAVAATATTNPAGANNALLWTAQTPGVAGNDITIELVDPPGNNEPLAIDVTGDAITVTLATDGSSVVTTTADALKTAIEADSPGADDLVAVADSGDSDGSGVLAAVAVTPLANGTDATFAPVSTATEVIAAIEGDVGADALVAVANEDTSDGSGVVTPTAATNLAYGEDDLSSGEYVAYGPVTVPVTTGFPDDDESGTVTRHEYRQFRVAA